MFTQLLLLRKHSFLQVRFFLYQCWVEVEVRDLWNRSHSVGHESSCVFAYFVYERHEQKYGINLWNNSLNLKFECQYKVKTSN